MKKNLLIGLTLMLSVIGPPSLAAQEQTERDLLASKLKPYGAEGRRLIEAVDLYAAKCGLEGSEMSILIYLGATPQGEEIKESIDKATTKNELDAAIQKSNCPTL